MKAYQSYDELILLADRTNGRAYATMLCLSACNVCIVTKRCVLPKICL